MTELDPLEHTLALARAELAPSPADKARLRVAIGLSSRPLSTASSPVVPRSWGALLASGKAGLLTAALWAGMNFGAGYWLGQARPAPEPSHGGSASERAQPALTPPEGPRLAAVPAAAVTAAPAPTPIVPSASGAAELPARPARAEAQTPAPLDDPNDELALLRRVERALRAADPALALALIGELDERYAKTALGEERLAARVMAYCGLREPGARLRAERFLEDQPSSVYSERVRSACALLLGGEESRGAGD